MKPTPAITSFDELPLLPELQQALFELGYAKPMPVQAYGLAPLLEGHSAVVRARTGTGKTALFALPLLQAIQSGNISKALILAPTRELAHQISVDARKLGAHCDQVEVACVIGGRSLSKQAPVIKRSNVLVMTPGRASEALANKLLTPAEVGIVVVDEADHMLEDGSIELCTEILHSVVTKKSQLVFCSATFSDKIRVLCKEFRPDAQTIEIPAKTGEHGEVQEWAINTFPENHLALCVEIIHKRQARSCIVFCNHRDRVEEVTIGLCEAGLSAVPLHGELDQEHRDKFLTRFREGKAAILVATDLGSRGIDVPGLELVINHDFPYEATDYVHRYGRTGRAGKGGLVANFYNGRAVRRIEEVEARTGRTMQRTDYKTIMRDRRSGPANAPKLPPQNTTPIHIRCGRKDGMTFALLKAMLRNDCQLDVKREVAFLDVHDDFTFIGVPDHKAIATVEILKAITVRGKHLHAETRNKARPAALDGKAANKPADRPARGRSRGDRPPAKGRTPTRGKPTRQSAKSDRRSDESPRRGAKSDRRSDESPRRSSKTDRRSDESPRRGAKTDRRSSSPAPRSTGRSGPKTPRRSGPGKRRR